MFRNGRVLFRSAITLDQLHFFGWLMFGQLLVFYGRYFLRWLTANQTGMLTPRIVGVFIIIGVSVILERLRMLSLKMRVKVLLGVAIGMVAAVVVQLFSQPFSPLAVALLFYLHFVATIPISHHECFVRTLDRKFWESLFDYMGKLIQYVLAMFVGSVAVLRFIYPEERLVLFQGDVLWFGSTVVYSFMFLLYWVLMPAWTRVVEFSAVEASRSSESSGK